MRQDAKCAFKNPNPCPGVLCPLPARGMEQSIATRGYRARNSTSASWRRGRIGAEAVPHVDRKKVVSFGFRNVSGYGKRRLYVRLQFRRTGRRRRGHSFDDENRTGSELHDAIGATSDQPFVERGVAGRADHHQVGANARSQVDDHPHGVAAQDVQVQIKAGRRRQMSRAFGDGMKPARGGPLRLPISSRYSGIGGISSTQTRCNSAASRLAISMANASALNAGSDPSLACRTVLNIAK
jgi:hypothetical protein